jgi:hypothetical protein
MSDMEKAYRLAVLAVRRRLKEARPEALEVLDGLQASDVSVYAGSYDNAQEVLSRLEVPFTLDPTPKKLSAATVIFANCSASPQAALVKNIEPLVSAGAWLVSSDYSLLHVVQKAFPGTMRRKEGPSTGDEVVAVEPWLDSLWSEVVVLGADPQWWLEGASYLIDIIDPQRVRIEAASHELLVKYGAPVVAARFDWNAGHVFHVISHFWMKRTRVPGRERYRRPCTAFLEEGMRLSEEGIAEVLAAAEVKPEAMNFATIQSAVTSTELVAQLCIHAKQAQAARKA